MDEARLPEDVRQPLDAPNYVHLSTLRADGSPRNHVVWVCLAGDNLLVCTSDHTWKAKDMRARPNVALSVVDLETRIAWPRSREPWSRYAPTMTAGTWTESPQVHQQTVPGKGYRPRLFRDCSTSRWCAQLQWLEHNPSPNTTRKRTLGPALSCQISEWRGEDLNLRPSGYEPDELPDCSTPRRRDHLTPGIEDAPRRRRRRSGAESALQRLRGRRRWWGRGGVRSFGRRRRG